MKINSSIRGFVVFNTVNSFSFANRTTSKSVRLNNNKGLTLNKAFVLIFVVGIFAHWPSLISDSNMWDDWIILSWILQKRLDWMFQFYHNYGVTPYFLVYFPFVTLIDDLVTANFIARILLFLGVITTANLIMLISRKVAHGNLAFATLAGVCAVSFPGLSGEGFHLTTVFSYCFIILFLTGILLFIKLMPYPHIGTRVLALVALFISFSFNSLLVMFYALVPAVFYIFLRNEKHNLQSLLVSARVFLLRYLDFLILPFIFWGLKAIFMPRLGMYARYNKINLDWVGILSSYKQLIPDILQITIFVPFSIQYILWVAAIIFIAVVLWGRSLLSLFESKNKLSVYRLMVLLGLGFLALLGAALPYYMVGRRSFQAFGYMSRDNALFPLPVSWILATLFYMLLNLQLLFRTFHQRASVHFWRRVALGIFAAFVVVQSVVNWLNHAEWQAHYTYYHSVVEKISRDKLINQASIIQVVDHIPGDRTLQTRKYPTSIWTEILSVAFRKTTQLAIPFPPENGRFFTSQDLDKRIQETEVDFMISDVNREGQQIRLIIEPTNPSYSPIRLALTYWKARFFNPTEMPKLLNSLTLIRSEPINNQ